MNRYMKAIYVAIFLAAMTLVSTNGFALCFPPNSNSQFTVVNDSASQDHLYWVDPATLDVCTKGPGGNQDLGTTLGIPQAGGMVVGATVAPVGGGIYDVFAYYVDIYGHIWQITNDSTAIDLYNAGVIPNLAVPWEAVAASAIPSDPYFSQNDPAVSVTYAVSTGGSSDKYGPPVHTHRFDFDPVLGVINGSHGDTDLYSAVGRGGEHLETQVNIGTDGNDVMFSTFDPEGEGHLQFISNIPGSLGNYSRVDLMDATGVGHMNVTANGGVIPGTTIPTCQASGTSIITNSGINFFIYGSDNDFHQLYGNYTNNFQKRDINHESGAPLQDGCGNFAAANSPSGQMSLAYEAVVPNGRALIQAYLVPGNGWAYTTLLGPNGGSLCNNPINVMQHSPITQSSDFNTQATHYYFLDVNGSLYRDCTVIF